jgi:hypothetical protein
MYTKELVSVLRDTADKVSTEWHLSLDRGGYSWPNAAACNCGQVAQVVLSMPYDVLYARLAEDESWRGEWSNNINDLAVCPSTGLYQNEILSTLQQLGLDAQDIINLEYLSDPIVLGRLNLELEHDQKANPLLLISYLRAWADLIETQLLAQTGKQHEPVRQSVNING